MGEIADDHQSYIADEMDDMHADPDHPSWDVFSRPTRDELEGMRQRQIASQCMHRFPLGRCPNNGCSGSPQKYLPF